MPQWISPRFTTDDVPEFPDRLSVDAMVDLFEDRTLGWYLDIAKKMASISKELFESRSGFAELTIVTNYFEMYAKFRDGYADKYDSEKYFVKGFRDVFGEQLERTLVQGSRALFPDAVRLAVDSAARMLYQRVRCDLYHAAATGPGIVLNASNNSPISLLFDLHQRDKRYDCVEIVINPGLLTARLKQHLSDYVAQLREPKNASLRENFRVRFRYLLRADRF